MMKLNTNNIPTKENGKNGWTINQIQNVYKYHYDNVSELALIR